MCIRDRFGKSKKEKFEDEQRRFDNVLQEKNMQVSIDQVLQLIRGGMSPNDLERAWEMQTERVKNENPEHIEDYVTYWKDLDSEVTKHYNEINRIQGFVGPNLTITFKSIKGIIRGLVKVNIYE